MKLLHYGPKGQEEPCVLDNDGQLRTLSAHVHNFQGASLSLDMMNHLRSLNISDLPPVEPGERIGACLTDAPNIHCVGRNYAAHAAETGADLPKEPMLFNKATSCLNGPNDLIIMPRRATALDYEVELAVVIGKEASYVSEKTALSYVSAYATFNDISERNWQKKRGGEFVKGKSAPTFGPIGPYLVTADEIDDPQNLDLSCIVNGEVRQSANTRDMVFSVAYLIHYISQFFTLRVGDVIATGTPEGVALGMNPPQFLQVGDTLETTVQGLGTQSTVIS